MSVLKSVLTPGAIGRIVLGWAAVIALLVAGPAIADASPVVTWILLGVVVAVILVAAFGVVYQAEELAHRLGDPYGSLILTISIVLIEVILIASVLLGPGEHATIARDSVLAVTMIILGLVIGLSIVIGARGSAVGGARVRKSASTSYVVMIAGLSIVAFGIPFLLPGGTYTGIAAGVVAVGAIGLYAWFLFRQMGPRAADYREFDDSGAEQVDVTTVLREHGRELLLRTVVLIVTVVPIVLMSHDMSALMDKAFTAVGAPAALAGVVIAAIVFTPETITTLRAALAGEFQRVVNLCLGAFVSTVGLTIPVVLVIGELTGQHILLAPGAAELALVGAIIVSTILAFRGGVTKRARGILPLVIFAAFVLLIAVS